VDCFSSVAVVTVHARIAFVAQRSVLSKTIIPDLRSRSGRLAIHTQITPALLEEFDFTPTPRVLFRSDQWIDSTVFPTTWPLLDQATPAWLSARRVRLIGMDVPSVDALHSTGMPLHHVIDRAGLYILENLALHHVEPGVYNLIALPLRIKGGNGSPIRAVLQTRD
jgi:arylformamidase